MSGGAGDNGWVALLGLCGYGLGRHWCVRHESLAMVCSLGKGQSSRPLAMMRHLVIMIRSVTQHPQCSRVEVSQCAVPLLCCHAALCLRSHRFWKRIVKGALPPTDLRSGSSLVQLSRTGPDGAPRLSFIESSSANKLPGQTAAQYARPINGGNGLQHH